jgi:hypothetical protein
MISYNEWFRREKKSGDPGEQGATLEWNPAVR